MNIENLLSLELLRLHGVAITFGALVTAVAMLLAGWGLSIAIQRAVRRAWSKRGTGDSRNLHAVLRLAHVTIAFPQQDVYLDPVVSDALTLMAQAR